MPKFAQLALGLSLTLSSFSSAFAQIGEPTIDKAAAAPVVTGAVSGGMVRFTAPSHVTQMRLEVFSATGEKVLHNEIRGGNVLDWVLPDTKTQSLTDGSYLCLVTVKRLSGGLSQRMGLLNLNQGRMELASARADKLSPPVGGPSKKCRPPIGPAACACCEQ